MARKYVDMGYEDLDFSSVKESDLKAYLACASDTPVSFATICGMVGGPASDYDCLPYEQADFAFEAAKEELRRAVEETDRKVLFHKDESLDFARRHVTVILHQPGKDGSKEQIVLWLILFVSLGQDGRRFGFVRAYDFTGKLQI